jgi:alanine racemase
MKVVKKKVSMAEPDPRCWVEVDGAALRHNLRFLRRHIPRHTLVMAVVKANAYGQGLIAFARECEASGIEWIGVANVHEGIELRSAGLTLPVLLLSACLPEEFSAAVHYRLTPILSSMEEARGWSLAVIHSSGRKKPEAHFKVDTGMGRLGAWHESATTVLAEMEQLPGVNITGICTHFASADSDEAMTARQWRRFQALRDLFPGKMVHAANSAGIFVDLRPAADCVRTGLLLYGVGPESIRTQLRPVMCWKSRLTLIHRVPAGRTISYGSTYRLKKMETLAVVSAGYGDGYFRSHSHRAEVLVGGIRCPIRGRVTMDQLVVDVSRVKNPRPGQEVVLLGRQGKENITADELATSAETIPYEILTNISSRVTRFYRRFRSE